MDGKLANIARDLYALPLDEFVAARTAAAKSAAGADRRLADAVRALPKPSLAAWAVNMLALHDPDAARQLTELGQSMRAAQNALEAGSMRELGQERRRALSKIMETLRTITEKHGRKISDAVAGEVEETLRAATADSGAAAAVRSGQLLRVLSADGVDSVDLGGAVAVPEILDALPEVPPPVPSTGRASSADRGARPERKPESGKPRLQAVPSVRKVATSSALEKATAALSEAEDATRAASEEAASWSKRLNKADAALEKLAERKRRLKEEQNILEVELDRTRREREAAAIATQQANRSAEKQRRVEELARQRMLRLRNTQN